MNTPPPPGVSVVMPCHADTPFLQPAIDSVLAQTHPRVELLVVVNGARHEALRSLLENAYGHDTRVRLLSTPLPGLPFALNLGLAAASHELIARMDSDDLCHPERLARQAAHLQAHPDLAVLGSDYRLIDEHGKVLRTSSRSALGNAGIRRVLPFRCLLCHPTVMFRKAPVLARGGFSFGAYSEDYDLWLRLRRDPTLGFAVLGEPLLDYRRHGTQATASGSNGAILAHDLALKLRELVITQHPIFLAGLAFCLVELGYKTFMQALRRLAPPR